MPKRRKAKAEPSQIKKPIESCETHGWNKPLNKPSIFLIDRADRKIARLHFNDSIDTLTAEDYAKRMEKGMRDINNPFRRSYWKHREFLLASRNCPQNVMQDIKTYIAGLFRAKD